MTRNYWILSVVLLLPSLSYIIQDTNKQSRNLINYPLFSSSSSNVQSDNFLNKIREYGSNRMARRAVGVLQQMPAYQKLPTEIHYTAAIWACAQSDQFELAMSVYEEMCELNIKCSDSTYDALIFTAERTDHISDVFSLFNKMRASHIAPTTSIYNSCIWAASRFAKPTKAMQLFDSLRREGVPCDEETYSALMAALDRGSDGRTALRVYQAMRADGAIVTTTMYTHLIWACVKSGMMDQALELFDNMSEAGAVPDEDCFTAAIWACELDGNNLYNKAVELLRLMKFNGLKRPTDAFNGAIAALGKAGRWSECLEVYKWFDRDVPAVQRDDLTYLLLIKELDRVGQFEACMEIYQQAFRQGLYSPWVGQTRLLDVSEMHPGVAKAALRNVFTLIRTGKLSLFNLNIIVETPQPLNSESMSVSTTIDDSGNGDTSSQSNGSEDISSSEPDDDSTVGDTERKYMRRHVWSGTRSMEVPVTELLKKLSPRSGVLVRNGPPAGPLSGSTGSGSCFERRVVEGKTRVIVSREALEEWLEVETEEVLDNQYSWRFDDN